MMILTLPVTNAFMTMMGVAATGPVAEVRIRRWYIPMTIVQGGLQLSFSGLLDQRARRNHRLLVGLGARHRSSGVDERGAHRGTAQHRCAAAAPRR